jgi:hypothetical protein
MTCFSNVRIICLYYFTKHGPILPLDIANPPTPLEGKVGEVFRKGGKLFTDKLLVHASFSIGIALIHIVGNLLYLLAKIPKARYLLFVR